MHTQLYNICHHTQSGKDYFALLTQITYACCHVVFDKQGIKVYYQCGHICLLCDYCDSLYENCPFHRHARRSPKEEEIIRKGKSKTFDEDDTWFCDYASIKKPDRR